MNPQKYKLLVFIALANVVLLSSCRIGVGKSLAYRPDISGYDTVRPKVHRHNDSLFSSGKNYLIKNKYQQWELYIEGDPMERGLLAGALMDSLIFRQEHIFFGKIQEFMPEEKQQKRITKYTRWFNRKLYKYVPKEYEVEIYGLSRYASHDFDYIANPFTRTLYLHAAHDIGHALVDMGKINVGCTSAALWGKNTPDGKLLVGRNLDFYFDDDFAKNKLILFMKPDNGIPFVSISWPGFLGVVSGMNKAGITLTMNAGKSKIPFKAKEPISIVARDILQHASTIDEAIEIARNSEVFVSEAFLIGSAKENKAVSIEMSPKNFGVYETPNSRLVCANHFQSEEYKKDKRNKDRIENGHSMYRYKRMNQLLDSTKWVDPPKMAKILRNKNGLQNIKLGYGNEQAINQLLAHHGIIFKPSKGLVWVSSNPYNLGAFTAYDLNAIFADNKTVDYTPQYIDSLTIPEDPFVHTQDFKNYEKYRKMDRIIDKALSQENENFDPEVLKEYCSLNPDLWIVYYKSGLLYYNAEKYTLAKEAFETALSKEITTAPDRKEVEKKLKKTNKKLK